MFLGIHKFMIYKTIASLCILLWSFSSNAIEPAKNSDKIKAAFLLHFTGYTTWPNIKTDQVNICLLGEVSFDSFLKSMVKAKPENRVGQKLNVLYLETKEELNSCHVAFVAKNFVKQAVEYRTEHNLSTLLVGESKGFIEQGGMVNFFTDKQRIRFQVCVDKVEAANIKMSADLLRLAVIYKPQIDKVAP